MSSSANPATRQALAEMGLILGGADAGNTDLNALIYYVNGAKALSRAGQYLAITGPDGQQLFAGGSPQDGVLYFTRSTHLFRTPDFIPLAQIDRNGLTVNANITHTTDNAFTFGAPDRRANVGYIVSIISTSDAREKTPVRPLTEAEIAASQALASEIGVFQWLAAIEEKGEAARLHIGMTVQRAIEIMEAHGLDAFKYGLICHDTWDAIEPTPAVEQREAEFDEAGVEIVPGVIGRAADPGREAGDRFSFREDQLVKFIVRGIEARQSASDARQSALEARLAALEAKQA